MFLTDCCLNTKENEINNKFSRGNLFYADLNPVVGSEQGGIRPVLIIQNDVGNKYSPTYIVAAVSSNLDKTNIPTHISLRDFNIGLSKDSIVLLEQIRTVDRQRLKDYIRKLNDQTMLEIDNALSVSFGLSPN